MKAFSMKEYFPEGLKGERFEIDHIDLTQDKVNRRRLSAAISSSFWFNEYHDLVPGVYTRLRDNKKSETVMTDTPMEIRSNMYFVAAAHGKVLIAGLGLGLVLISIQDKEDVESIYVVEIHKEIIDLVAKRLPLNNKVRIIQADIFKFNLRRGVKLDTIYFDIWNNISGDNYTPTKILHRKFQHFLNRENPRAWMDSWRREDFKKFSKR